MASLQATHFPSENHQHSSPCPSPTPAYPQPYQGELNQQSVQYPVYNFAQPSTGYHHSVPVSYKTQLAQPQLHLQFPVQDQHYNPNRYYQLSAGEYNSPQLPWNYNNPIHAHRHTSTPQSAPPGFHHTQMPSTRANPGPRQSESPHESQHDQGTVNTSSFLPSPATDHINTSLLQPSPNGAFLSPHYSPYSVPSSNEQDLRKVSDTLRSHSPNGMYAPHSYVPSSNVRGDYPFEAVQEEDDNQYEKERVANIMENQKLFDSLGLGVGRPSNFNRSRAPSIAPRQRSFSSRKHSSAYNKRELIASERVRASPRIASRNISYADIEGQGQEYDDSNSDEYDEREGSFDDEEDFRPTKRIKGNRRVSRVVSGPSQRRSNGPKPSLFSLTTTHPGVRTEYPLFYFALLPDLTVNPDAVPLIGSVPPTSSPVEKAAYLRAYFHRVRRLLAQLDAFTSRCERKHDGPGPRWPELDYFTRTAIRDVRRKAVERSENYKYTRRDLLNKAVGKNKWEPIEAGLVEWRIGMIEKDPANDLDGIELIPPSPPPHYKQLIQQHVESDNEVDNHIRDERIIRPIPNTVRRMPSSSRSVSIATSPPDANGFNNSYAHHHQPMPRLAPNYDMSQQLPVQLYSDDGVTMQMQVPSSAVTLAPDHTAWDGLQRGVKRERSASDDDAHKNGGSDVEWVSPELEFGTA